MPLYRLTPISPNDPNWQTSIHRQVAVIRADSEEQARSLAAQAFNTTLAASSPGRKMATPRWHRSDAVRAEVIQDPRYGSEGPAGILEPWGYSCLDQG
jgi:acyl-CoA hydrolase